MQTALKNKLTFASYDFSNSGYVIMFQSFLFPILLTGTEGIKDGESSIWPWIVIISSILAIIGAPYIGKAGDLLGKWKIFAFLVAIAGIGAAFIPAVFPTSLVALTIGFLIFNTAFEYSQSIYDSFLLNYEKVKEKITSLSTFAWGFGYVGGALFAVLYFLFDKINWPEHFMLLAFGSLYLLLSIPAIKGFRRVEKETKDNSVRYKDINWKQIISPSNPVPWFHIAIYWIIADAVAAVLYFAPLFLKQEIGLSMTIIGGLLLAGQLLAFPLTILMGRVANRFGRIKTIQLSLIIWAAGLVGLYFATTLIHVVIIMVALAFVFGSTQAILRAHFASRVNLEASGEGLGFYAVAQKSASVVSPALVGVTVLVTDSLRPAFLILAILIAVGFFLAPKLKTKVS